MKIVQKAVIKMFNQYMRDLKLNDTVFKLIDLSYTY